MDKYPISNTQHPTPQHQKHLWQSAGLKTLAQAIARSIRLDRVARRIQLPTDDIGAIIPLAVELEEIS